MNPSKRKDLEGRLGALAFRGAQKMLENRSAARAEAIGAGLGVWLYRVSGKRRRRAIDNLLLAMHELGQGEANRLARRVFAHFGRVAADFVTSGKRTVADVDATTTVCGIEHVDAALASGKGALLLTGHIGNWERISAWVAMHGYPLSVIIRDADDGRVNQMVNRLRSHSGTRVIPRGDAVRPILARLKANEIIGIVADQNSDEVYIPFFGKPAGTVLGPGVIAERTGAPILTTVCWWEGPGRYAAHIDAPLMPHEGERVGEGYMRAYNAWLEARIRERPEQWLWFHDRWRNARRKGLL